MKPLKRFTDRIGKTIYRDTISCGCKTCKECTDNWIEILNKDHAEYLHTVHCEMWIKYRDTKAIDWDQKIKDLFWI